MGFEVWFPREFPKGNPGSMGNKKKWGCIAHLFLGAIVLIAVAILLVML